MASGSSQSGYHSGKYSSPARSFTFGNDDCKEGNPWCGCGMRTLLLTSWTRDNPGRRFLRCPVYREGGCGFFRWYDPSFPNRAKEVINDLLESRLPQTNYSNGVRRQLKREANNNGLEKLKWIFFFVVLVVIVICFMKVNECKS